VLGVPPAPAQVPVLARVAAAPRWLAEAVVAAPRCSVAAVEVPHWWAAEPAPAAVW
jgi:hypothetical protein